MLLIVLFFFCLFVCLFSFLLGMLAVFHWTACMFGLSLALYWLEFIACFHQRLRVLMVKSLANKKFEGAALLSFTVVVLGLLVRWKRKGRRLSQALHVVSGRTKMQHWLNESGDRAALFVCVCVKFRSRHSAVGCVYA